MGLLIKNGTILTATSEFVGDILVEGEKIVEIGLDLPEDDHEVVDASGKYVMPGGVDEHVHMGPFDTYGFETSHAALVGGTTTIVDFAPQFEGMGVIDSFHKHKEENAEGIASCDFSFHGMVMNNSEDLLDEIPKMVENGINTLKFFVAYKYTPFMVSDDLIFKSMQLCRDYGITPMVHCENGDLVYTMQQELVAEGKLDPIYHAWSRPPIVEDEATNRVIEMAKLADCPMFIVHVSSKGAASYIKEAYEEGYSVYGETCAHYLTLNIDNLAKPDFEGAKYVCAPALRPQEHLDYLWERVANGDLLAISSDHAAVVGGTEAKDRGRDRFDQIPNGCPSFQDRMHMIWTQGVEKGKISRQDFVRLMCTNPAKVCGFYPQKGALLPGSDADILIWDPTFEGTIKFEDSYEGTNYAAFEGWEKKGIADKVYLRGRLMAERGKLVGEKAKGKFVPTTPYSLMYDGFEKHDENFDPNVINS